MTTAAGPRISVIILNYNGKHLIEECLESLFCQTYQDREIIVVDNGSTDGSPDLLERRFHSRITLIRKNENLGFAGGNNAGIASSAGEYIALLNNDAIADRMWLQELAQAALRSDPSFGMWASKILFYDNRNVIDTAGHLIYRDGLNRGRGKHEFDRGQYDREEEVFFPSGCAALYRREMLDRTGAFDPEFFAYGDDTDLGLKARLSGWKCLFVPTSIVYHKSSSTAGSYSPLKAYLVERNRVWVLIKYFPLRDIVVSPLYTLLRFSLQAYGALAGKGAAGRFVEDMSAPALLRVLMRAYIDALRKLPLMIRKRREFRTHIRVSVSDFRTWLRKFSITAREISLKE